MSQVLADSFNRANSTTTLGNADTGQTWSVDTVGAHFGISSNQAYCPDANPAQAIAVVPSGLSDGVVSMDFPTTGDTGGVWRETDDSNNWTANNFTSFEGAYKKVAGSYTLVASLPASVNGDHHDVILTGSSCIIRINGVQQASFSDAFNSTATRHGFRINGTVGTQRIDNFSVDDGLTPVSNRQHNAVYRM